MERRTRLASTESAMAAYQKDPLRPLTSHERLALEQVSRSHTAPAAEVARAKELIAVADGASFELAARAAGRKSPPQMASCPCGARLLYPYTDRNHTTSPELALSLGPKSAVTGMAGRTRHHHRNSPHSWHRSPTLAPLISRLDQPANRTSGRPPHRQE